MAATRAARDAREWGEAERLARLGLARFPAETVWPVLLALVQVDAGRPEAALATLATPAALRAEAGERGRADAYARLAEVRALRDRKEFAAAEAAARAGLRRHPGDAAFALILGLVLADQGRADEARAVLRGVARGRPLELLLAEGYAAEVGRDPFAALDAYAAAARLAPGMAEGRQGSARVLDGLGGPFGAEALLRAPPPPLEVPGWMAANGAAAMVRWGASVRPSPAPERRFDGTDAALARIDALLVGEGDAGPRRRLEQDRVVALRDRVRMHEAEALAERLAEAGPLPGYVRQARADALLYLRRPEAAAAEFQAVLAADPGNQDARYGLFYAQVEAEDFTAAYATVDAILAAQPPWRGFQEDPTRYPNPDYTPAALTAAQARFYGDQLAEAWRRLEPLVLGAPANQDVRLAGAAVAGARGWPHLAAAETEIAANLAPQRLSARIALAELDMAQYRFAAAERRIAELMAVWPENRAVQRLARDLDAQRRFVLEAEVRPGDSDGGGANASGKTIEATVRLYSPPIADNWRLFALSDAATAQPPEGYANRERVGAGVEYRAPYWRASAYATQSFGTLNRAGGGATLDWTPDDQWRVSASAELFSASTPLRGLLQGVTANEVAGRATWRRDESLSVSAALAWLPFSDGNRRLAGGVELRARVLDLPHWDITARGDLYSSRNTLTNVPYFSPKSDVSATGGVLVEHVAWRRYDNSFVHALTLDAGTYTQQGYGTDWIATVGYEHRWRFDPLTEFRYGVQLTRRVYDGSPENGVALFVALTQRI